MKRILAILIVTVMVVSLLPVGTFAETSYKLWIGTTEVTGENLSGEGWSFEPSTNTLTLDGFAFEGEGHPVYESYFGNGRAAIAYRNSDQLNLVVAGVNTVKEKGNLGEYESSLGIFCAGTLNISGSGALYAFAGDKCQGGFGIYSYYISISGASVYAEGGNNGYLSDGCFAYHTLTVESGRLFAEGGPASTFACGIEADTLTVNGGKVIARSKSSEKTYQSYGFFIYKSSVFSNCIIEAVGGETDVGTSVGITGSGSITIDKSVVSFVASGEYCAIGHICKNGLEGRGWNNVAGDGEEALIGVSENERWLGYKRVEFGDAPFAELWVGECEVTSVNTSGDGWEYTPSTNTLTLDGFTYEGVGHAAIIEDYFRPDSPSVLSRAAISYFGSDALNLVVKGENSAELTGKMCRFSQGIFSNGALNVSGTGSLVTSGGVPEGEGYGIRCYETFTLESGKISALGDGIGLYAGDEIERYVNEQYADVVITGGELYAAASETEEDRFGSCGIRLDGDLKVTGGKITARAGWTDLWANGISTYGGNASFDNCIADISGGDLSNVSYGLSVGGHNHEEGDTIVIGENVISFIAYGKTAAADSGSSVKASCAVGGGGWTDVNGKATAIAAGSEWSAKDYKKVVFPYVVKYDLWVGTTEVTSENLSGTGWS
ncbi:MAG: hypothetical protein IKX86_00075, partial [Clostridia bacterium]|nr:hypothetical protein [Clostridia bacterium]